MIFHCRVAHVKAVSFQDIPLKYSLQSNDQRALETFAINEETGEVTLLKSLPWVSSQRYFYLSVQVDEVAGSISYTETTYVSSSSPFHHLSCSVFSLLDSCN
jgi:hypothetical protein